MLSLFHDEFRPDVDHSATDRFGRRNRKIQIFNFVIGSRWNQMNGFRRDGRDSPGYGRVDEFAG